MFATDYIHVRGTHTAYEVADVFREYGDAYRARYPVTDEQAQVMAALVACRTAALGGQIYECLNCGAVEFAYCSCRNRHCPKCQKFERAQWVEAQQVLLLPIPYFHVVFTTDHALNAWVPANRAAMPKADPGRWVKPEEIAALLAFLASDAAASVSGALIPIYGRA